MHRPQPDRRRPRRPVGAGIVVDMKLNDMMAPPPVHLPAFADADAARAAGKPADEVIRICPRDSAAWADLALSLIHI